MYVNLVPIIKIDKITIMNNIKRSSCIFDGTTVGARGGSVEPPGSDALSTCTVISTSTSPGGSLTRAHTTSRSTALKVLK